MVQYLLKMRLMEKGITQKQLAEKTGINESLLSLGIRGKYIFSTDQMLSIAEALDMPVNKVFDVIEIEVNTER